MTTKTRPKPKADEGRRADIEAWLNERHVPFSYDPALPLDKVDEERSLHNQARLEALDPDVVERYTADLKRGDTFPPIVVVDQGPRRRHIIIGGNHRYAAHKAAGLKTVAAYIVVAEGEMVLRLTYEDNRRHGLPPSTAERVAQGVHLLDNGWTNRDAAACVGVPEPTLSIARKTREADRRAKRLGGDRRYDILPKSTRYHLGKINSDPIFTRAAQLTIDAQLGQQAVTDLVKALNGAGSDDAAAKVLDEEAARLREAIQRTAGTKTRTNERGRLQGALVTIAGIDPALVASSTPSADIARTVKGQIVRAVEILARTEKALPR